MLNKNSATIPLFGKNMLLCENLRKFLTTFKKIFYFTFKKIRPKNALISGNMLFYLKFYTNVLTIYVDDDLQRCAKKKWGSGEY